MNAMKTLALAASAATLLGVAATAQAAGPFNLSFEGAGSTADVFAPIFLTIGYGQFVPSQDEFGDSIPGSEHWELDLSGGSVPVLNPSTVGWGNAPGGSKALDARGGPVLFVFGTPFSFASFSATLDSSTFGDLADTDIKFYGADNALLFSLPVNQSTPGFIASTGALNNVKTIMLPSTAFYDNVQVQAVPEPSAGLALAGGIGMLLGYRRRRS